MESTFLKLRSKDFWHGLISAIISAMVTGTLAAIGSALKFNEVNFQLILLAGIGGFVGFIGKTFFSNSDNQIFRGEVKPE